MLISESIILGGDRKIINFIHSENLKKNIRRSEKLRQYDADENKSSTTQ